MWSLIKSVVKDKGQFLKYDIFFEEIKENIEFVVEIVVDDCRYDKFMYLVQ